MAVATSVSDIAGRAGRKAAITSRPRASASMKSGPVPARGMCAPPLDATRLQRNGCPAPGQDGARPGRLPAIRAPLTAQTGLGKSGWISSAAKRTLVRWSEGVTA
ncbi:hypothetical protein GCM10009610_34530 [Pseudonocardia xinjiangensis]